MTDVTRVPEVVMSASLVTPDAEWSADVTRCVTTFRLGLQISTTLRLGLQDFTKKSLQRVLSSLETTIFKEDA